MAQENEYPIIRRCGYRNCSNVIEGKSNKKFCSLSHRRMEHTYLNRRKNWLKDAISLNQKEVDAYKNLVDIIKNSNN